MSTKGMRVIRIPFHVVSVVKRIFAIRFATGL